MKNTIKASITLSILLATAVASADYSIPRNPADQKAPTPGYGTRPPVTPPSHTGEVHATSEENKKMVNEIVEEIFLGADHASAGRKEKLKQDLFKLAEQDLATQQYLAELRAYFESSTYRNQSESKKRDDRFDARMILDIVVQRGGANW